MNTYTTNLTLVGSRRLALRVLVSLFYICITPFYSTAQTDIEQTISTVSSRLKKDPLKIYGGLDLSAQHYLSRNQVAYFPEFTYRAMASLQFDFLGVQAPFTFIHSNGNSVYNLPAYSFVGISPSYRWATLHVGDRNMELSPYTLSGHQFKGIGLELKPGHWRFSGMYGQLRRAVAEDFLTLQGIDPTFRRMGWGVKAGYETEKEKIAITVFHALDDSSSIPLMPHLSTLQPAENLACAIQTFKKMGPWSANFDYTYSLFSRDTRSIVTDENSFHHHAIGLFTPRISSSYRNAFQTKINFTTKKVIWGFNFDHVDPGFRSMGTLFFQDDFQNYTFNARFNAFKNKVNVSLQSGLQRNYLEKEESNQLWRGIGSAQINIAPIKNLQWQVQWSNISNTVRFRNNLNPNQPLDSLYLVSTQSQSGTTIQYSWGAAQESSILGMIQYQKGNTIVNDVIRQDQTNFLFAQTSYNYRAGKVWSLNAGLQYTQNSLQDLRQNTIGPSVQYQRSFLDDKLKSSFTASDQEIFTNNQHTHRVISLFWANNYQLNTKHEIYLRINHRSRRVINGLPVGNLASSDWITEVGYTMRL